MKNKIKWIIVLMMVVIACAVYTIADDLPTYVEGSNDNQPQTESVPQYTITDPKGGEPIILNHLSPAERGEFERAGFKIEVTQVSRPVGTSGSAQASSVETHSITIDGRTYYGSESYVNLKNRLAGGENNIRRISLKRPENLGAGDHVRQDKSQGLVSGVSNQDCGKGRTCDVDSNGRITRITNKDGSVQEMRDDVVINSPKGGGTTLTFNENTITMPSGSQIKSEEIDRNLFNALNAINEQDGGLSGTVTYNKPGGFIQSGNQRSFIDKSGQGASIVQTMSGSGDSWTQMSVRNPSQRSDTRFENIEYTCEGRSCTSARGNPQKPAGSEYSAEARADDGFTTLWVENSESQTPGAPPITTRTEFEQVRDPSGRNTYGITRISRTGESDIEFDNPIIPQTGLLGTYYVMSDGRGGTIEVEYDEDQNAFVDDDGNVVQSGISPEQAEHMEDSYVTAQHGGGFNWFGDILGRWGSATAGYSAMSLFYDEPDPIIELDQTISTILGGIDSWTSLICKSEMTDSLDTGMAFSSTSSGAYAHIEGEKIEAVSYNESTSVSNNYYKLSVTVDPGTESAGCDINFNVFIKGKSGTKHILKGENDTISLSSSVYGFSVQKGGDTVSYSGSRMLFFEDPGNFDSACISFNEISPEFFAGGESCLVGVLRGDTICNSMYDHGSQSLDDNNPCSGALMSMHPICWG